MILTRGSASGQEPIFHEFESVLDSIFARHMTEIPGAAIVVVKDGAVLEKGYGFADISRRVPVSPERTVFRVASVSKVFTTAAVLQLVERGRLRLDADVNTYLRRFTIPATYPRPITLSHLLTHTAGFDEVAAYGYVRDGRRVEPLGSHLAWRMPRRVMPPGEGQSYSNYSFALAGHIVEQVSGTDFSAYVDENIFRPLGMSRSTFAQPLPADLVDHVALSYGETDRPLPMTFVQAAPSGGMSTTVHDVGRFLVALVDRGVPLNGGLRHEPEDGKRILSDDSLALMYERQFSPHPKVWGLTYGFGEYYMNGHRLLLKGGDGGGFNSLMVIVPERRLGYFLTSNRELDNSLRLDSLRAFVEYYLPSKPAVSIPEPMANGTARVARFAGTYRWNRYPRHEPFKIISLLFESRVTASTTGVLRLGSSDWIEVEPLLFRRVDADEYMVFRENDRGEVVRLLTSGGTYDKLPWYESARFYLPLTTVFISLFALGFIMSVAVSLRRSFRSQGEIVAMVMLFCVTLFNLTFIVSFGILRRSFEMPWALLATLSLPLIASPAVASLPAFAYASWRRRWWSRPIRAAYLLLAVASLAFVLFLQHWNLIGIRY